MSGPLFDVPGALFLLVLGLVVLVVLLLLKNRSLRRQLREAQSRVPKRPKKYAKDTLSLGDGEAAVLSVPESTVIDTVTVDVTHTTLRATRARSASPGN